MDARHGGERFIACGLDPKRVVLFRQSDVPEHTELAWILTTSAAMGDLHRMTQFKEKSEQQPDNANAGIFIYPVLQAADILLYKADRVPVGRTRCSTSSSRASSRASSTAASGPTSSRSRSRCSRR